MIKAENVRKVYAGEVPFLALDNISFEIKDGEFVGICGKSGCGKSTLLNLIGGLDGITSGTIEVQGKNVGTMGDRELSDFRNRTVSFVFQAFYLDPNLTVSENVAMPLLLAGVKKKEREKKAIALLERLSLKDKARNKPAKLSGGEMQRAAIARALITDPAVILADEPTGNLDVKNGREVLRLLKEINESGTTVIMVSHNPGDLENCTRIIELSDGKIIRDEVCG